MSRSSVLRALLLGLVPLLLTACELPGEKKTSPLEEMKQRNTELAKACLQGGGTWEGLAGGCKHTDAAHAACITSGGVWMGENCLRVRVPTLPPQTAPAYRPTTTSWIEGQQYQRKMDARIRCVAEGRQWFDATSVCI